MWLYGKPLDVLIGRAKSEFARDAYPSDFPPRRSSIGGSSGRSDSASLTVTHRCPFPCGVTSTLPCVGLGSAIALLSTVAAQFEADR